MAETKAKTADKATEKPTEKTAAEGKAAEAAPVDPTACVVDDGTPHVGRAVNGRVCSRHAMHYRADGTRR